MLKTSADLTRQSTAYDYERQAWVENGVYVRCGHPESMSCGCYGRLHAGEAAPASVLGADNA